MQMIGKDKQLHDAVSRHALRYPKGRLRLPRNMKDPEMCGRHSVTKRCNLAPKTRPSSPKHYCHQADTMTIGLTLAGTDLRNINYENTMFI